jgi:hypothetical protein
MTYDFPEFAIAYSLIRFSTRKQADGDSFRRQDGAAEDFCRRNDLPLDRSLHEADLRKLGISGFTGEHIVKGPLKKFLAGVESGTVKPGAILLVSEWNRLTRQVKTDAKKLVFWLFEKGIGIVDLQDGAYYTFDRYNSDVGLSVGLDIKVSMAHQYSESLRRNLTSVWQGRRQKMQEGTAKPTEASPEWLHVNDKGEYEVDPRRLRVIEFIKEQRFLNRGKRWIARELTERRFPTWRTAEEWAHTTVQNIVKNVALTGRCQPHNKRRQPIDRDGNVIGHARLEDAAPNVYPRVMSDDDWQRMQWAPGSERANPGRKSKAVANLFYRVPRHCSCGASLHYIDKRRGNINFICSATIGVPKGSERARCTNRYHHRYLPTEKAMLRFLRAFDYSRLLTTTSTSADRIAALRAEIAANSALLETMAQEFSANVPKAFVLRAQRVEAENIAKTVELIELERTSRIAELDEQRDAYTEFTTLVDGMAGLEPDALTTVRTKLANEFARVLDRIEADGKDLIFWLRANPHFGIGFRVSRSRIATLICQSGLGDRVEFAGIAKGADGELEKWVDGTGIAEFERICREQAATITAAA